jgi:pimeloyl-ACP methyl ester carboxylesterase
MNRAKRRRLITVLIGVCVVLLVLGSVEFLLYTKVQHFSQPPRKESELDPNLLLLKVNEIPFRSADNVELHGWLIPGRTGYPALIIAHDYASNRSIALGKLEGLVSELSKLGYFVFLFDFRGHGASGSRSYLGYREAADVEAAIKEVLKYKQIGKRIGVLGIGMGAAAAVQACRGVVETKLVILDSVTTDIPGRITDELVSEWPFLKFSRPVLLQAVDWNLRRSLRLSSTALDLGKAMPELYPRAVLFAEPNPPSLLAKELYESAREPKEILQLGETAIDDLMGESRGRYKEELLVKIQEYFPAVDNQPTIEIGKE